jgi:hypothetical protein
MLNSRCALTRAQPIILTIANLTGSTRIRERPVPGTGVTRGYWFRRGMPFAAVGSGRDFRNA